MHPGSLDLQNAAKVLDVECITVWAFDTQGSRSIGFSDIRFFEHVSGVEEDDC